MINQKGFTLVELAIVILIIGLIIGGILKGNEMIVNARNTSTIAQVKSYQGAIETFSDKFSNMPGDMATALTHIPGCTAASFCFAGDGNTIIGMAVAGAADMDQTGTAAPQVETSMFWKHLALADLITGISPGADPAIPTGGDTHPIAKVRVVFVAATKTMTGSPDNFPSGLLLKLQSAPAAVGVASFTISPKEASSIDIKMDDGQPNTGYVAAERMDSGCKTDDTDTGDYNYTNQNDICVMYFRMR